MREPVYSVTHSRQNDSIDKPGKSAKFLAGSFVYINFLLGLTQTFSSFPPNKKITQHKISAATATTMRMSSFRIMNGFPLPLLLCFLLISFFSAKGIDARPEKTVTVWDVQTVYLESVSVSTSSATSSAVTSSSSTTLSTKVTSRSSSHFQSTFAASAAAVAATSSVVVDNYTSAYSLVHNYDASNWYTSFTFEDVRLSSPILKSLHPSRRFPSLFPPLTNTLTSLSNPAPRPNKWQRPIHLPRRRPIR